MNFLPNLPAHAKGRFFPTLALSAAALTVVIALASCRDDVARPVDDQSPAAVSDLRAAATGSDWVDLRWSSTGDDGLDRPAVSCLLRMLPGGEIATEEQWAGATAVEGEIPTPGDPGSELAFRVAGLAADSLYGFCVRLVDNSGNVSPLSNAIAVRTAPPPPPDAGLLQVTLQSQTNAYQGARIVWDVTSDGVDPADSVLVADVVGDSYSVPLLPGQYRVALVLDCAVITPEAELDVTIQSNQTSNVTWSAEAVAPITVESSVPGAAIYLDGQSTGEVTPAVLNCLEPGEHTLSLRWPGGFTPADSARTIQAGTQPAALAFDVNQRVSFLELLTATLCTYCVYADCAVESLWRHEPVASRGYIGVQVHLRWMPNMPDSFRDAPGVQDRIVYLTGKHALSEGSAPLAIFNGRDPLVGVPSQSRSCGGTLNRYLPKIEAVQSGTAPLALQLMNASYDPVMGITGTLRVILTEDLPPSAETRIYAGWYKDRLHTGAEKPEEIFYKVIRGYEILGTAAEHGLANRWDSVDLPIAFDVSGDTRFPDDFIGLLGFVQNMDTAEVYQAVHQSLRP